MLSVANSPRTRPCSPKTRSNSLKWVCPSEVCFYSRETHSRKQYLVWARCHLVTYIKLGSIRAWGRVVREKGGWSKIGNPEEGSRQGKYEWLSLPFGIVNNLFNLLCIEVIFIYNILFLSDIGIIILFLKLKSLFIILIIRFDWKVLLSI